MTRTAPAPAAGGATLLKQHATLHVHHQPPGQRKDLRETNSSCPCCWRSNTAQATCHCTCAPPAIWSVQGLEGTNSSFPCCWGSNTAQATCHCTCAPPATWSAQGLEGTNSSFPCCWGSNTAQATRHWLVHHQPPGQCKALREQTAPSPAAGGATLLKQHATGWSITSHVVSVNRAAQLPPRSWENSTTSLGLSVR
jgi:hypothetical protein